MFLHTDFFSLGFCELHQQLSQKHAVLVSYLSRLFSAPFNAFCLYVEVVADDVQVSSDTVTSKFVEGANDFSA